jgi:hypothetical protein
MIVVTEERGMDSVSAALLKLCASTTLTSTVIA